MLAGCLSYLRKVPGKVLESQHAQKPAIDLEICSSFHMGFVEDWANQFWDWANQLQHLGQNGEWYSHVAREPKMGQLGKHRDPY